MNDEGEPMVRPRNVSLAVVRSGAAVAELANNEPATIAKKPTRIPIATSPFCSLQGKPFRLWAPSRAVSGSRTVRLRRLRARDVLAWSGPRVNPTLQCDADDRSRRIHDDIQKSRSPRVREHLYELGRQRARESECNDGTSTVRTAA